MQSFTGIVLKGQERGRALGYPTANIKLTDDSLSGVYAAKVIIDHEPVKIAAAFADPSRGILEAHILDFAYRNLYGFPVTIELYQKVRESARFDSDEALKAVIADDIAKVREYFKN